MPKTALIAVGGNSLIRAGEKGTIPEQLQNAKRTAASIINLIRAGEKGTIPEQLINARRTAAAILGLIRAGYRLVITHGNGPQVGSQLLRSERASDQVPSQPLDVCGAATQGEIGYLLSQSLNDELAAAGLHVPVVSVITQTLVSRDDPAMQHPTKPIGPFYSKAEAEKKKQQFGWQIVEDASRGYRRVVPSPDPIEIVELEVIRDLVNDGVLVVAAGGGGIPVVRENGGVAGVEAVIDKDRASALLASQLGVDLFAISTDADFVYLDYKKPAQRPLHYASVSDMQRWYDQGQFPPGNMGPKIQSALRFLRAGGHEVIITTYDHLCEAALGGSIGTHILPDGSPQLTEEPAAALAGVTR